MTIRDITEILSAQVICGEENLEKEVHNACGSDMMSDVLAFVKDQSLLITGLCNPQVIRTAEMMDIICICFVRGKEPDDAMVELAKEYPEYDFEKHKGYGTKLHYEKLKEFGISNVHRKTFLKNLGEK